MMAFTISVDLSGSPAPYSTLTILMSGYLFLISIGEALDAVDAGAAGLVVGDDRDLALACRSARPSCPQRPRPPRCCRWPRWQPGCRCPRPSRSRRPGCWRPWPSPGAGSRPCESSAAKQIAAGFLSSAVWSISICLSTSASLPGPSNVMSTFRSLAAFSEPSFTACQNWCWKPFEMTGMYGFAPLLAAAGAVVAAAWPPVAACVARSRAAGQQGTGPSRTQNRTN